MSEPAKRGSNGGNARAAKLTKEQRSDIAKKAAEKRWGAKSKENTIDTLKKADTEWLNNHIVISDVNSTTGVTSAPSTEPLVISGGAVIPKPFIYKEEKRITPAEKGRRRASKDKPVSKVYKQALSTAEKEYAETVEELSYHDEMAARLKSKLPRLIQTIRALGGTIDPQAELLQYRQLQTSNYGPPMTQPLHPVDPMQNLPNPIDPALYTTNANPVPGLAPAVANAPLVPDKPMGGAIDLGYTPVDDGEGPGLPKMDGGWM